MRKRTRRLIGALVVGIGAVGAAGSLLMKRSQKVPKKKPSDHVWARPGMQLTFRAELMPGRDAAERTFKVAELLVNRRVRLIEVSGEHAENEFEPVRFG